MSLIFKGMEKIVFLLISLYLAALCGLGAFYLVALFLDLESFDFRKIFLWVSVGLSVSLLASLSSWPFALSFATLMEHRKKGRLIRAIRVFLKYYSSLPLVLFVYIYVEVIGEPGFLALQNQWTYFFSSSNFLTQSVAFAITLLLYPLTILPFFDADLSVDSFFQSTLERVIDFAQAGLVAVVVVLGLFLYILPKMILFMEKTLKGEESLKSFEIIKSLGGTSWESIHMTVMQSMKNRFNSILIHFTRVCFFEGLITYSLLHFFMFNHRPHHEQWGASLSSLFISFSIKRPLEEAFLWKIAGVLLVCYLAFTYVEMKFIKKERQAYASS